MASQRIIIFFLFALEEGKKNIFCCHFYAVVTLCTRVRGRSTIRYDDRLYFPRAGTRITQLMKLLNRNNDRINVACAIPRFASSVTASSEANALVLDCRYPRL